MRIMILFYFLDTHNQIVTPCRSMCSWCVIFPYPCITYVLRISNYIRKIKLSIDSYDIDENNSPGLTEYIVSYLFNFL